MEVFEVGKIYLTTGGYPLKVVGRNGDSVTITNENKCTEVYKIHNTPTTEVLHDVTAKYDIEPITGSKTYRTTLSASNSLDEVAKYISEEDRDIIDEIAEKFKD